MNGADGILFNVYYNESTNSVRIVNDEPEYNKDNKRQTEEVMVGQTESSVNARDLENILTRVKPGIKVEIIGAEGED